MTTITALLTNKAYGYPTRGAARRRRKPTILACLHQTSNCPKRLKWRALQDSTARMPYIFACRSRALETG
jgi:hypothetical protein